MSNVFVLFMSEKVLGADFIYAVSDELRVLYEKIEEVMKNTPEILDRLVVSQLVDKEFQAIMTANEFIKVMKCIDEEVNMVALKNVIECKNTDFLVAFLREIISPKEQIDSKRKKHFCNVLNACESLMQDDLALYRDVCKIAKGAFECGKKEPLI